MSQNKELDFLYSLFQDLYQKPTIDCAPIESLDLNKILHIAKENNLLYYCAKLLKENFSSVIKFKDIQKVDAIINDGEKELVKIAHSLKLLNANVPNYILVKTYRNYPRIANDLDIIVKNFEETKVTLENLDLKAFGYDKRLQEVVLQNHQTAKIHLHGKIGWLNRKYFDTELIYENPRTVEIEGTKTYIPNTETDLLIHLAHMNFEPMHFTLSEMLYIYKIGQNADWKLIFQQARKYHWCKALINTLIILQTFHFKYYNHHGFFEDLNIKNVALKADEYYKLPKSFPRMHIVKAFLGKGVIVEPIQKLHKTLKVLVTGNSYKDFYQAPEESISK